MSSIVSVAQYAARFGKTEAELSSADVVKLTALLSDATALARLAATPVVLDEANLDNDGYVDETIAANPYAALIPILVEMVKRSAENPRSLNQEQIGDYMWSSMGNVIASKRERRLIRLAVGASAAGSIELEGYLNLPPANPALLGEL